MERGKYCKNCNDRHWPEEIHQVVVGSERGTTFPPTINQTICNALIDTGASRSCISEKFYRQMNLPPVQELLQTHVRSATGGSLSPIGTTKCTFKLGEKEFTYTFIVCKHLLCPMIIGADFLRQKQIFVGYSEIGKCVLEYKHLELVSALTVDDVPKISTVKNIKIPQRSLAVINTKSNITEDHVGQMYKMRMDHLIQNEHPNLIFISTLHRIDEVMKDHIPIVVINVGRDDIWLKGNTVLAHLNLEELDISEITTQSSYDSGYKSNDSSEEEGNEQPIPSAFITSPADIETHRKVNLKDKEIDPKYRKQFDELCEKYKAIFSVDSTGIGKTPLLQMEVEIGNRPPICQKPYTLALKHAE